MSNPANILERALDKQGASSMDVIKQMLRKYMDHARAPEDDLIALYDELKLGGHTEALKFLDEAIDMFSKARSRLYHTIQRLPK